MDTISLRVLAAKHGRYFYLMKILRRKADVYCTIPDIGFHLSHHQSGESHFRFEGSKSGPDKSPPAVMMMGEAGEARGEGIQSISIDGVGHAVAICTAVYDTKEIEKNYREYARDTNKCFIVDLDSTPEGTSGVEVGVWAVPVRNEVSFDFNNPGVEPKFLFKEITFDPQVWVFARSF